MGNEYQTLSSIVPGFRESEQITAENDVLFLNDYAEVGIKKGLIRVYVEGISVKLKYSGGVLEEVYAKYPEGMREAWFRKLDVLPVSLDSYWLMVERANGTEKVHYLRKA